MPICMAFVQEYGNARMEPEMRDMFLELQRRGIPVELFTEKRMSRRQLPIRPDTLVVGTVPVVLSALQSLGIAPPPTNDYPVCLEPFLRRRIWRSTVGQLMNRLYFSDEFAPVFAKPEGRKKRFTGRVFQSAEDVYHLEGASKSIPILCSDVTHWVSEYRTFVINGRIVGTRHYSGDPMVAPDHAVIAECVARLEASPESTAGYGLDFGVLDNGTTAIVEWNDGYSLGSYGLCRELYCDLLLSRWEQLNKTISQPSEDSR